MAAWTRGLQSAGVAACAKHFPGHGDTAEDSHLALPVLNVDMSTLAARELVPFVAAIEAGTAAVMTSHVVVPALDPDAAGDAERADPRAAARPARLPRRDRQRRPRHGGRVRRARHPRGRGALDRRRRRPAVHRCRQLGRAGAVDPGRARRRRPRRPAGRGAAGRGGERSDRAWAIRLRCGLQLQATSRRRVGCWPQGAARSVTVSGHAAPAGAAPASCGSTRPAPSPSAPRPGGCRPTPSSHRGRPTFPDGPLVVQVRDAHRQPDVQATLAAAGPGTVVVEWGWPGRRTDDLPTIDARGWSQPGAVAVTECSERQGGTGDRPSDRPRHRGDEDPRRARRRRRPGAATGPGGHRAGRGRHRAAPPSSWSRTSGVRGRRSGWASPGSSTSSAARSSTR